MKDSIKFALKIGSAFIAGVLCEKYVTPVVTKFASNILGKVNQEEDNDTSNDVIDSDIVTEESSEETTEEVVEETTEGGEANE